MRPFVKLVMSVKIALARWDFKFSPLPTMPILPDVGPGLDRLSNLQYISPSKYNFQKMSRRMIFSIYILKEDLIPFLKNGGLNLTVNYYLLLLFPNSREISQWLINEHFAGLIVRGFVKRQSTTSDLFHFTNFTAKFEDVKPIMLFNKLSLLNFVSLSHELSFSFFSWLQNIYMVAYPDHSLLLLVFTRSPRISIFY